MRQLGQTLVLNKAHMVDSFFGWDNQFADRFAAGHDSAGKLHPVHRNNAKAKGPAAASSMFTTIEDYARFGQWVLSGAGLPDALFDDMQTPQAMHDNPAENYGLGWKLTRVGEETVLWHDGREPGVNTQVVLWPERNQGIVVLTNSDNGHLLTRRIIENVFEQGSAWLQQGFGDAWVSLQQMPPKELENIMNRVLSNPVFTETVLLAIESVLPKASGIQQAEREQVRKQFHQLAIHMLESGLAPSTADTIRRFVVTHAHARQSFTDAEFRSLVDSIGLALADQANMPTQEQLKSYEGVYRIHAGKWAGMTLKVRANKEALHVQGNGGLEADAVATSAVMFAAPSAHMHLEFQPDSDGKVDVLIVHAVNNQKLVAKRVQ